MKTIPVYTGVSAAFQKQSPSTLHNRKRMSHDHSCRYNHRYVQVDALLFVTLDHKTSHKGQFFEIEIYRSSESWMNKLSIDVWLLG